MTKGPVAAGLGRAEELSEAGEYEAALQELDRQLTEHPLEPAVHTARGWALENLGPTGLPEARDAYRRALELDPAALWAKEGLSNVYRRMGEADEANRLAREVIEEGTLRCDKEIDLLELVGWCQLRLGEYASAVATLRRALELDGRWTAVRFDLALALICAGDGSRASCGWASTTSKSASPSGRRWPRPGKRSRPGTSSDPPSGWPRERGER
jgi:Flp pilus assembly protein TadD